MARSREDGSFTGDRSSMLAKLTGAGVLPGMLRRDSRRPLPGRFDGCVGDRERVSRVLTFESSTRCSSTSAKSLLLLLLLLMLGASRGGALEAAVGPTPPSLSPSTTTDEGLEVAAPSSPLFSTSDVILDMGVTSPTTAGLPSVRDLREDCRDKPPSGLLSFTMTPDRPSFDNRRGCCNGELEGDELAGDTDRAEDGRDKPMNRREGTRLMALHLTRQFHKSTREHMNRRIAIRLEKWHTCAAHE